MSINIEYVKVFLEVEKFTKFKRCFIAIRRQGKMKKLIKINKQRIVKCRVEHGSAELNSACE